MNIRFLLLSLFSFNTFAQTFKPGAGSEFYLRFKDGQECKLSIYVTHSELSNVGIEYYFYANNGIVPIDLWQQFHFKVTGEGPLQITAGYLFAPEMRRPEAITSKKYLNVNQGVKVNDFLFSSRKELQGKKVGEETVSSPAGKIKATHYRVSSEEQTVDFWLSEKTKPIGLVKLISTSKKNKVHNYQLDLLSLIKNVKPKINPKQAGPLTEKGKAYLSHPLKHEPH